MDSLQDHLLIAMPNLDDPYFNRSVIYICEHDDKGAMGIIINQPIAQFGVNQLLEKLQYPVTTNNENNLNKQVFNGGPGEQERGFILHTPQTTWSGSLQLSDDVMITTSKDILEVLGTQAAPQNYLIALGFSAWSPGQLEQELVDNSWLTIQADSKILYNTAVEHRWIQATKRLGFDIWQLTSQVGHS